MATNRWFGIIQFNNVFFFLAVSRKMTRKFEKGPLNADEIRPLSVHVLLEKKVLHTITQSITRRLS